MDSQPSATPAQQKLVMWVLWGAFLVGVCVQYHFLHNTKPPAADVSKVWLAALAPVMISIVIRWNFLPRVTAPQPALVLMILGVALAESAMFIGMFVFPTHQFELFAAAFLGILQHAPVYAGQLFPPPPQP